MRCKSCNVEIDLTYRDVELENKTHIKVEEDLCYECKGKAFDTGLDRWADYYGSAEEMYDKEWCIDITKLR